MCPTAEQSELGAMWKNAATYLKPSRRLIGIIENQDEVFAASMRDKMDVYGARQTRVEPLSSGDGVRKHVEFNTQPKIEFDAVVLKRVMFEEEATKAGLVHLQYFRPGEEAKAAVEGKDDVWWTELLEAYPNTLFIARKT